MKTSLIIYRPLSVVWTHVTSTDNWRDWWGGTLESVVPAWEEGAILRWSQGEPTQLSQFQPGRQFTLQGMWMETIFRFDEAPGGSARIEVEIRPRSGASFPDGGKAHIEDISAAIDRLKRVLEGAPLPVSQVAFAPEPAPVETEAESSLRGRSYLVLMVAMIGIGFIFSLIPCLVVNTLCAGGLSAWLWIRREKTLARLCPRRGLLAGMLAGLGGTLIGSMFFLWEKTEADFIAILLAITAALALFLLPAALAGLLTGFVISRRAVSKSVAPQASRQETETISQITAPIPAMLQRDNIENRMQAVASQGLSRISSTTQADTTRQVISQVISGAEFAYAVDSVLEILPICLADQSLRSTTRQFPGILVSVTVFPVWTVEQVRKLLPDGYVKLVQEIAALFQQAEAKVHVAHWVFASDGNLASAYLTVIPNPDVDRDSPALIARELLNEQERAELGV